MDPKVSIIIPTKNRADYVSSAIQSVLDQTFGDLEIIVVDGASIDNTQEVISKFDDERIRYIRARAKTLIYRLDHWFQLLMRAYSYFRISLAIGFNGPIFVIARSMFWSSDLVKACAMGSNVRYEIK